MRTLYLRNVPDEVVEGLQHLASREGLSVSAFTVRELHKVARRAANAQLLADAPVIDIDRDTILEVLDESRAGRTDSPQ